MKICVQAEVNLKTLLLEWVECWVRSVSSDPKLPTASIIHVLAWLLEAITCHNMNGSYSATTCVIMAIKQVIQSENNNGC